MRSTTARTSGCCPAASLASRSRRLAHCQLEPGRRVEGHVGARARPDVGSLRRRRHRFLRRRQAQGRRGELRQDAPRRDRRVAAHEGFDRQSPAGAYSGTARSVLLRRSVRAARLNDADAARPSSRASVAAPWRRGHRLSGWRGGPRANRRRRAGGFAVAYDCREAGNGDRRESGAGAHIWREQLDVLRGRPGASTAAIGAAGERAAEEARLLDSCVPGPDALAEGARRRGPLGQHRHRTNPGSSRGGSGPAHDCGGGANAGVGSDADCRRGARIGCEPPADGLKAPGLRNARRVLRRGSMDSSRPT